MAGNTLYRMTAGETWESCLDEIRALPAVQKYGDDVTVSMYEYNRPSYTDLVYPIECYFPTWVIPKDHKVTQALEEAYKGLYGEERLGNAETEGMRKARPLTDKWTFSTNGVTIMGRNSIPCIGFGPGAEAQMTLALVDACEQADVLIGAGRMTKAVEKYQKPMLAEYSPEKIYEYLKAHPEYEKIVLLQSGDVGFYSGAKKLQAVLAEDADFSVRVEPGISSLVYFCAKIGVSWEDAAFVSLHGQHCNFLETVRRNRKTLAIAGGKGSVREICQTLSSYYFPAEVQRLPDFFLSHIPFPVLHEAPSQSKQNLCPIQYHRQQNSKKAADVKETHCALPAWSSVLCHAEILHLPCRL